MIINNLHFRAIGIKFLFLEIAAKATNEMTEKRIIKLGEILFY